METKVKDFNREELMKKIMPLYESCKLRQLKSQINENLKDEKLYAFKGSSKANEFNKIPFDDFENNRNEGNDKCKCRNKGMYCTKFLV
jgi:hypothetical protein